ncbi:MAG: hypothetical protein LBQ03_00710 [Puniceicoccales bacterium]|nr:hypothetical protein [Puniceicoccales bacterium]
MNMKILQIYVVAAMAMGGLHVTYASSARNGFKRIEQRNAGMSTYNILHGQELTDTAVSGDVRSWMEKLCVILSCDRSDISVYRLWGTGGQSENSLPIEDTLLSIADLIRSKRSDNAYLSPKEFITPDRSKGNQHDWEMDWGNQKDASIQKCFVKKTREFECGQQGIEVIDGKEKHALAFSSISTAAKIPVLVIDSIYEGNFLGEKKGGFKNFLNQLDIYSGFYRDTIDGGLLFDDDIQGRLKIWIPCWATGMAWFFVIYQKNIYMIYYKNEKKY